MEEPWLLHPDHKFDWEEGFLSLAWKGPLEEEAVCRDLYEECFWEESFWNDWPGGLKYESRDFGEGSASKGDLWVRERGGRTEVEVNFLFEDFSRCSRSLKTREMSFTFSSLVHFFHSCTLYALGPKRLFTPYRHDQKAILIPLGQVYCRRLQCCAPSKHMQVCVQFSGSHTHVMEHELSLQDNRFDSPEEVIQDINVILESVLSNSWM